MTSLKFSLLDLFLKSELPLSQNIILVGPPGVGKTTFCETLLSECLENGIQTLYITLDDSPKKIKDRLSKRIDLSGKMEVVFVDAYSWLTGGSTERFHVGSLSNLSDLSVKIVSASSNFGEKAFFIFDSISTLLIYNSENEVERFLEVNIARMKNTNSVGIWVVEQGIHSESFYNVLRHMADGILEMRFVEESELKRFIRLHSFKGVSHDTSWKAFSITAEGIAKIG